MADLTVLYSLGIALIVAGVIVIVLALIRASTGGDKEAKVRGAGVIMIGPIPIIFGTDKSVEEVLVLALALAVVMLIVFAVYYWWLR